MSAELRCRGGIEPDTLHRYVAGTLNAAEEAAFEIHLLTCPACQADVRMGAAVATTLRGVEPATAPKLPLPRNAPHRRRRMLRLSVSLAAAAALLLVLRSRDRGLEELGAIGEPPVFQPLPVRGDAPPSARRADEGMAAYMQRDYRRAAARLAEAAAHEPTPGTHFFLGVALLAAGEADSAVTALRAALEPRGNVYAAEAHYYLAKAWLRRSSADSALAHLNRIAATPSPLAERARALADSVRARQRSD